MTAALQRDAFRVSRQLEFFSEKELTAQIGHECAKWPLALLKELIDNGLDACDMAGIAPVITVDLSEDGFTVSDNGPGLPLAVLEGSIDYSARVSDKLGYISPSRGQQGNALKTLWAAPFVVNKERGFVEVETAAYHVAVRVTVDTIAQEPVINVQDIGAPHVKTGTKVTVHWPDIASWYGWWYMADFYMAVADFNPHATIIGTEQSVTAALPDWPHWRPDRPTAPHWYSVDQFRALVALALNAERRGGRQKTVNEFIREFHGLTGTPKAKAVAAQAGLTGAMLSDLVDGDDIDTDKLRALLAAMQSASRPVNPELLGLLKEEHVTAALVRHGAAPDSVQYRRETGEADGMPYVLEVAFAVKADEGQKRTLSVGINYSPTVAPMPFDALNDALNDARCTLADPVVVLLHLAYPAVRFTDRGKSRAVLPKQINADIKRMVERVTARYTAAKRQADRNDRIQARAMEELRNQNKQRPMTVKAAAWAVMESAYLKASSDGTLPANARQIMYVARPDIIAMTGNASPLGKSGVYFTQDLLPDFITEHPDLCADWDVVFDDRGHFTEPHTDHTIGVGTLAVRGYVKGWQKTIAPTPALAGFSTTLHTQGPALRYRFVLFVEKEGFAPLLQKARIAERYDIAIMSTKGMSTTAARCLVENLSDAGVTVLVMRDFDMAGFTIVNTLRTDTRRYQFKTPPNVVDIGLRLADVQAMDLAGEDTDCSDKNDPRPKLRASGATVEEANFLVSGRDAGNRWIGQRVELNAMTSAQLVQWLEGKLEAHGVRKFVPEHEALAAAWKRAWRIGKVNAAIAELASKIPDAPDAPADLADLVTARLAANPLLSWDDVLPGIG